MGIKEKIEAVKEIPIPAYMRKYIVPKMEGYYGSGEGYFEYRLMEKCPVHDENTASFRYYAETNTCSCFGCGFGGDIISLHRKFREVNEGIETNFREEVEYLYDYFVSGNIVAFKKVENTKKINTSAVNRNEIKEMNGFSDSEENESYNTEIYGASSVNELRFNRRFSNVRESVLKLNYDRRYRFDSILDLIRRLVKSGGMGINEAEVMLSAVEAEINITIRG